jgi:MFS family permease
MNRDLLLVALSLLTWGMGEGTYLLFQPLYLQELGANPLSIGAILGGVGIAKTLAHIPAGYLADRFGRRIIMWSAWLLGVLAAVLMASAQTLTMFTIGATLYGFTAFVIAPMNSYITAARGSWTVGRTLTFIQVFFTTGAIFGPFLGGLVGDRFGYAAIYRFATIIYLVSTVIIFFIRSQPVEKTSQDHSVTGLFNHRYLGFLPVLFLAYLGMYLAQPLAPNFLQNIHGQSLKNIGLLGSINSIGSVGFNIALGALSAPLGFVLGQAAVGVFSLLMMRGASFPAFAVAYFMLGGFRPAAAMAVAQLQGFITSANMGLAYGIAETITGLSLILAPVIAGLLYEKNPIFVFQAAIFLIALAIITALAFNKWSAHLQRQNPPVP